MEQLFRTIKFKIEIHFCVALPLLSALYFTYMNKMQVTILLNLSILAEKISRGIPIKYTTKKLKLDLIIQFFESILYKKVTI